MFEIFAAEIVILSKSCFKLITDWSYLKMGIFATFWPSQKYFLGKTIIGILIDFLSIHILRALCLVIVHLISDDVCVWLLSFNSLPSGAGLFYYINGKQTGPVAARAGSYAQDTWTTLTIGKPNHASNLYGTFRMDHLVIFYKQVTQQEINVILQGQCWNY